MERALQTNVNADLSYPNAKSQSGVLNVTILWAVGSRRNMCVVR